MSGQIRLRIRYHKYASPWFDYLMASPEEMQDLVKDTPWRVAEILGDTAPAGAIAWQVARRFVARAGLASSAMRLTSGLGGGSLQGRGMRASTSRGRMSAFVGLSLRRAERGGSSETTA